MNWIFKELQWKAEILEKENFVPVFDIGVVKSDTAVPEQLKQLLKEAIVPFEDVPDRKKDYHPGSDGKVVDLVHPSLFPVVYGRTHVLRDRLIGLDDCLKSTGEGEQLPIPPKQNEEQTIIHATHEPYSQKFQWLPCDVQFTDDDDETGCRITSYINNVHPVQHRDLYGVVEKIIARAIPLWNKSLTLPKFEHGERIEYSAVEYLEHVPEPVEQEGEDEEDYWQRYDAWQETQPIQMPEPSEEFKPPNCHSSECVDLRKKFREGGLQVIVKLANIELTPEKPDYKGGSWHIEGQLVSILSLLIRLPFRGVVPHINLTQCHRTNESAQQLSTTTTARTSPKADSPSANAPTSKSSTSSATNRVDTSSSNKSTGSPAREPLSQKASHKISEASSARKAGYSLSLTSCSIVCPHSR